MKKFNSLFDFETFLLSIKEDFELFTKNINAFDFDGVIYKINVSSKDTVVYMSEYEDEVIIISLIDSKIHFKFKSFI